MSHGTAGEASSRHTGGFEFYAGKPIPMRKPEDYPSNGAVRITKPADPAMVEAYHNSPEYKRKKAATKISQSRPFTLAPKENNDGWY